MLQRIHRLIHQQINQQIHRLIHQQINQQIHRLIHQQINQQIHRLIHQQINQQIHRPMHQQIHRPILQQINPQIHRLMHQQIHQRINRRRVSQSKLFQSNSDAPRLCLPSLSDLFLCFSTVAPTAAPTPCTVRGLIESVSLNVTALSDPASYQSQSLEWLCDSDRTGMSDAQVIQRWVLVCFYFATNNVRTFFTDLRFGEGVVFPWLQTNGWLENSPECGWVRLNCNAAGQVTGIDMVRGS